MNIYYQLKDDSFKSPIDLNEGRMNCCPQLMEQQRQQNVKI